MWLPGFKLCFLHGRQLSILNITWHYGSQRIDCLALIPTPLAPPPLGRGSNCGGKTGRPPGSTDCESLTSPALLESSAFPKPLSNLISPQCDESLSSQGCLVVSSEGLAPCTSRIPPCSPPGCTSCCPLKHASFFIDSPNANYTIFGKHRFIW